MDESCIALIAEPAPDPSDHRSAGDNFNVIAIGTNQQRFHYFGPSDQKDLQIRRSRHDGSGHDLGRRIVNRLSIERERNGQIGNRGEVGVHRASLSE
jgi:hypothetical protein